MMRILNRTVLATGLAVGTMVSVGCGGKEQGPADPSKVPSVDPAAIEKEINRDEGKKYLPKGFKGPAGVMPPNQAGNANPPSN